MDGTYTGTGWSRRGSVSVAVTIRGGRIASAPITGVTTHYDQSVIDPLPGEVLAAQGSRIDLVSGATDSSLAYQQAVAQALAKAGSSATGSATTGNATSSSATSGNATSGNATSSMPPAGGITGVAPAGNGFSPRGDRGGDGFDRRPYGNGQREFGDHGNAG